MSNLVDVRVNALAKVERGVKVMGIIPFRFEDVEGNINYAFAANMPNYIANAINSVCGLKMLSCNEEYMLCHASEYDYKSRLAIIKRFKVLK